MPAHVFINQSVTVTQEVSHCALMGMPSHSTGKGMLGDLDDLALSIAVLRDTMFGMFVAEFLNIVNYPYSHVHT